MSFPSEAEARTRLAAGYRRQCLFAVTILLVEDSRSASEALRLMAAESGARLRRADSLHAAARHLAIYRPAVTMVDLGLPDGDGMALVRHLAAATPPYGGVIALSGHDRTDWQAEALASGAAACLEKPIPSLAAFQDVILRVLPDGDTRRPDGATWRWPAAPRSPSPSTKTCGARAACSPTRCPPGTRTPWPTAPSSSAPAPRCSPTPSWPPPASPPVAARRCSPASTPAWASRARPGAAPPDAGPASEYSGFTVARGAVASRRGGP
jgi:CheY-like chemotaxis protein